MASNPLLPPLKGASASSFFIPSANEQHTFHPHETVQTAMRVTLESAGVGLLVSAVQNALDKCVIMRSGCLSALRNARLGRRPLTPTPCSDSLTDTEASEYR